MVHGAVAIAVTLAGSLATIVVCVVPWSPSRRRIGYGWYLARKLDGDGCVCLDLRDRRLPSAEVVRLGAWLGYHCVHCAPLAPGVTRWRFERDSSLPYRAWEEEWLWHTQR